MKKGILCILLSLLLVTPLFVGCNQNTGNVGTEAIVYTLYTICEEGTTEESITQVELALNRLLFYRLNGIMVKLEMVTEDKYDELIAEKYEEVNEYQEKVMDGEISVEEGGEFITGDDVLKMLENGEEIPLDEPRLDIFLVRGYDQYLKYVDNADVQELDSVLDNYGKALKSNIHGTLFEAAKINNKIYGVPVNHAIDQYTYLVFDKEYVGDFNCGTVSSLKDLEDYLQVIKETAPDVVPLKNVVPSTDVSHLLYDGSPFLVSNSDFNTTTVAEAYKDATLRNHFALIAKYKQLGYLGNGEDAEGTKYAVRFEKGKLEDLKELYPNSEIVKFSAPVATSSSVLSTNPETIGNIFCVSKFVASNDVSNVMSLLNALNTDPSLMNILLYGVENEHYILTEDGQIKRERQDYIIDPNYIGNAFIAKTLYDENDVNEKNKNIWLEATKQNQETIPSPGLGFAPTNIKFSYLDGDKTVEINEPDYYNAIKAVTDKYYQKLLNGEVEFDYEAIYNAKKATAFSDVEKALAKHYEDNVLRPLFETEVRNSGLIAQREAELREQAKDEYMGAIYEETMNRWWGEVYSAYQSEHPNATSAEIEAHVASVVTEEFVNNKIEIENDEKHIQREIDSKYNALVNQLIKDQVDEIAKTPRYLTQKAVLLGSERYAKELREKKIIAEQQTIPDEVNKEIVKAIDEQIITPMNAEIETAIETVINEFFEEYKEVLGYETIDSLYIEIGYYVDKTPEQTEESDEPVEPVFGTDFKSWFEFVYTKKIAEPFKANKEQVA